MIELWAVGKTMGVIRQRIMVLWKEFPTTMTNNHFTGRPSLFPFFAHARLNYDVIASLWSINYNNGIRRVYVGYTYVSRIIQNDHINVVPGFVAWCILHSQTVVNCGRYELCVFFYFGIPKPTNKYQGSPDNQPWSQFRQRNANRNTSLISR